MKTFNGTFITHQFILLWVKPYTQFLSFYVFSKLLDQDYHRCTMEGISISGESSRFLVTPKRRKIERKREKPWRDRRNSRVQH